MLSRIANSLFWLGRYLERAEHLARYAHVQYFSSLDAPESVHTSEVLESLLYMNGDLDNYKETNEHLIEEEVLQHLFINRTNPSSIIYSINKCRENARGAIDSLSSEIWESINKYYHHVNSTDDVKFRKTGLYEYTQAIEDSSSIVFGYINSTLIQDNVYSLIKMGIHLERSIQVMRIMDSKFRDMGNTEEAAMVNYQWATLLKCAESFDMYHRFFNKVPTRDNVLSFLLFNRRFPKSVTFNLNEFYNNMTEVFDEDPFDTESVVYETGKIKARFLYMTVKDLDKNLNKFINKELGQLYYIANRLENEHLNY